MENKHIVTAESVRAAHPDKLCDQIADAILDAHLFQDPNARVAVEVFVTDGKVLVAGEVTSNAKVNYKKIIWDVLGKLSYTKADLCSDPDGHIDVEVRIHEQSPDIADAVDGDKELGAGDQGIMVGYATNETSEMLPLPVVLAHRLCQEMDKLQREVSWMGADGKAQVSVVFDGDKPLYVKTVVISVQHEAGVCPACLIETIINKVVLKVISVSLLRPKTRMLVNPSGNFVLGGSVADTGLTDGSWRWISMGLWHIWAAVRSPARTQPRLTAVAHTWRGTSPRISWHQGWRIAARCRLPMLLGKRSLYPSACMPLGPAPFLIASLRKSCAGCLICALPPSLHSLGCANLSIHPLPPMGITVAPN